jgi:hypothetical protein
VIFHQMLAAFSAQRNWRGLLQCRRVHSVAAMTVDRTLIRSFNSANKQQEKGHSPHRSREDADACVR